MTEAEVLAAVEAILGEDRRRPMDPLRPVDAQWALSLCVCISYDESPTWLLAVTRDGRAVWSHVPDGVDPFTLVRAETSTGDHVGPEDVLRWLQGERSVPWPDAHERDDGVVADAIRAAVVAPRA